MTVTEYLIIGILVLLLYAVVILTMYIIDSLYKKKKTRVSSRI